MKKYTETQVHFDERIVQYIEGKRINLNGVYEDIPRKREFIRDVLGYSRLRTGKNQFVPLSECNESRISVVVKEAYSSAKRRLEEYRREQAVLSRTSGANLEAVVKSVDF